jgi:hypothetical protein
LDLTALGTIAATDESLAGILSFEDEDDELEEVDVVLVDFLLLLPQAATTAVRHTATREAATLLLHLCMGILLKNAREHKRDVGSRVLAFR